MGDYPNSDEEFELMYQDELELLREQEDYERPAPKSRKSLEFNSTHQQSTSTSHIDTLQSTSRIDTEQGVANLNLNNSFQTDFTPIQASQDEITQLQTSNGGASNKRTIEELFGDIDDILYEGMGIPVPKRSKTDKTDNDLALIEHILQLRKLSKEHSLAAGTVTKDYTSKVNRDKYNVSLRVPKFPFIVVTRHDGERVYVRCHSEEYEREEIRKISVEGGFAGVMGELFKDVWNEANAQINKELETANEDLSGDVIEISALQQSADESKNLWVDLYRPKRYLELLSDESTNRLLLRWIKLWDRVVFNRRQKIKPVKFDEKKSSRFKFKNQESLLKLDENGWPECKVALLCGPPGLGKTTLAHVVARHAGYNVIEINASDDRSLDKFKEAVQNATSMRSVLDREGRPNCLIFDEIDGAPAPSIDFLVKFITGVRTTTNKLKNAKKQHVLKRPIVCICNDIYVPSLRPLRQIALIVTFPQTLSIRLAERLNQIARHQEIKTDISTLLAMAEKSHNDIRSCLSVLQFFKSQNKPRVTLSDVLKSSVGQKDMQEGLFSVWNTVFRIERAKQKIACEDKDANGDSVGVTLKTRMNKVLQTVNSFGDYERLMQGVFENYTTMKSRDSSLVGVCEAIEWFCFSDVLNKQIYSQQDYSLSTYLQYGFVVWHFMFASLSWQKLNYPNTGYEVKVKMTKQKGLLTELIRGMPPAIRIYTQPSSLKLEVLPYLIQIMVPSFRPVNLHLYTPEEKTQLNQVVSAMIDYNLTYIQERTPEGSFVYNLDPNVEELVLFPESKPKRTLSYSNRQIVAREIELEKMRRIEAHKIKNQGQPEQRMAAETKGKPNLPNHLQQLKAKKIKPKENVTRKDFFGRIITSPQSGKNNTGPNFKYDIWYKFKEGYTNAVRRKVKIKNLK